MSSSSTSIGIQPPNTVTCVGPPTVTDGTTIQQPLYNIAAFNDVYTMTQIMPTDYGVSYQANTPNNITSIGASENLLIFLKGGGFIGLDASTYLNVQNYLNTNSTTNYDIVSVGNGTKIANQTFAKDTIIFAAAGSSVGTPCTTCSVCGNTSNSASQSIGMSITSVFIIVGVIALIIFIIYSKNKNNTSSSNLKLSFKKNK